MQLDLLLRSKDKHCGSLFSEVFVLYSVSSMNFELGYEKLKESWPSVNFVEETSFRQNVFDIMGRVKNDVLCVLADDCIFYRQVDCADQIEDIVRRDSVASFTLGIGGDSEYSVNTNHYYRMPEFTKEGNALIWNWKTADKGEFECPFMLAANFYKKEDYVKRLSAIEFNNPSWYEFNLQKHWQGEHRDEMPDLCACGHQQYMVHSMNNVVQSVFGNAHGDNFYYSVAELNLRYLGGQAIDLDQLHFGDVNGLHTEVKFFFTKGK